MEAPEARRNESGEKNEGNSWKKIRERKRKVEGGRKSKRGGN